MANWQLCVMGVLAIGCGTVKDETVPSIDAPPPTSDAALVDAPDVCTPHTRVAVQFTATNIFGSGTSTLDVILNHPNGYILDIPDWTEERGIDSFPGGPSSFKTAVKSATWRVDYTGQDEALLDSEVGANLLVGGAFRQAVFELSDDKSVYLYVLPTDTNLHPYMETRCNNAPFVTDPATNFPVLATFTATGCGVTFFDFRAPTQRNVVAQGNATFELTYQTCP